MLTRQTDRDKSGPRYKVGWHNSTASCTAPILFLLCIHFSFLSVPEPKIQFCFPFSVYLMRKLCPNFDREDGLDTVLEVPIPEEMFSTNKNSHRSWPSMKSWVKSSARRSPESMTALFGGKNTEIQLLLGVVGAPLIPMVKVENDHNVNRTIKDQPIVSLSTILISFFF